MQQLAIRACALPRFRLNEVLGFCEGGRMTPEELKTKIDELRTLIVEKLAELEEDPKWGSEEERETSRRARRAI